MSPAFQQRDRALPGIEAKVPFTGPFIRAMTGIAVIGQYRTDVKIKIYRFRKTAAFVPSGKGKARQNRQKKTKEEKETRKIDAIFSQAAQF